MAGNRAWIYCRVNGNVDDKDALEAQKRELELYAREHKLEIVGASSDMGNGLNAESPGMMKLRTAMKAGVVDVLVLKSLSCLGRGFDEVFQNWKILREDGVRLRTQAEGEVYLDMRSLFLELFGMQRGGQDRPPV